MARNAYGKGQGIETQWMNELRFALRLIRIFESMVVCLIALAQRNSISSYYYSTEIYVHLDDTIYFFAPILLCSIWLSNVDITFWKRIIV